jgi:glyoxalase family protein
VVARPDAAPGAPGIGGSHHFALAVRDRAALLRWKRRLLDEGHAVNGILDRHYFQSLYVQDPDGQIVELATLGPGWAVDEEAERIGELHRDPPAEMVNLNRDRARIAAENWPDPVAEVDAAMRIPGLHHVTAIGAGIERTEAFVAGRLGMRRVKRTNNFDDVGSFHWYWGVGAGAPGTLVTYFDRTPERERPVRMGAGQLAHYAVAAAPAAVDPLRDALAAAGLAVSPPAEFGPDGATFRAVGTHDPDGHPVVVASGGAPAWYDAEPPAAAPAAARAARGRPDERARDPRRRRRGARARRPARRAAGAHGRRAARRRARGGGDGARPRRVAREHPDARAGARGGGRRLPRAGGGGRPVVPVRLHVAHRAQRARHHVGDAGRRPRARPGGRRRRAARAHAASRLLAGRVSGVGVRGAPRAALRRAGRAERGAHRPDGTPRDYAGSLDGTPVFLGCSDVDGHIPAARVRESADVLRRLGGAVDVRLYPGMGHLVNDDEVGAVRAMLAGALAAGAA